MNSNEIIYSLSLADIETVANQEFDKILSQQEINETIEIIAKKINWYEVIAQSIAEATSAR